MPTDKQLNRVVVGVDAVPRSDTPLHVGIDLARRFGAELEFVHGVKPPHHLWPDLTPHDVDAARRVIETRMEASLAGARQAGEAHPSALVVESTRHPAELLLSRAANPSTDLLVVGRHRRRGLVDFGGTLRAVLSQAKCPVWVQSGPVRLVKRILVPVDLSEESLAALRHACAWALQLGASLRVIHCFQQPELFAGHGYPAVGPTYVVDQLIKDAREVFEKEMSSFAWTGAEHEIEFVEDEPATAILDRQDSVDLVMMGSHGRTGLAGALLGNVALTVLLEGHVPVVVMREPGREWVL